MKESILNFNKQFDFEPEIVNSEYLSDFDHIILCGMGGSHLAADLIKTIKPGIDLYVYKDYDLPPFEDDFFRTGLLVACSYSGDTEETISFFENAFANKYNLAIITTGGVLLDQAKDNNIPFIEIPNTGIEPRQSQGYLSMAILKLIGDEDDLAVWGLLSSKIKPDYLEDEAIKIVEEIGEKMPIIYSSSKNLHISYNWKITFNETAKIPSFYNVFPELNHNEIQGFENSDQFNSKFHVIFIYDNEDDERIDKRMKITQEIYEEKEITTSTISMDSGTREEKVFNAIILGHWVAYLYAERKGIDPQDVPTIKDFKKKLLES